MAATRIGLGAIFMAMIAACAELRSDRGDIPAPPTAPALNLEYDPEPVLPRRPSKFQIELMRGACRGDCPSYSVAIDQEGTLSFFAQRCVLRPGSYRRQIDPEQARAVYDALIDARYPSFKDRYLDESDGCQLVSDAPSEIWKVRADGRSKSLKHYLGCRGVEGLDAMRDVEQVLLDRSDVLAELKPPYVQCESGAQRLPDSRFRISADGAALGVLQVRAMYGAPRYFELYDCAGELTARGDAHTERARVVLLGAERGTITLPRRLGEAASLILDVQEPNPRRGDVPLPESGRALREQGDVELTLTPADSCD